MNESHISLKNLYEVTGPELDALAEAAWEVDGVCGSRMTGAGFGGCTVSLVEKDACDRFMDRVGAAYTKKTGLAASFYIAGTDDGARLWA
jgi:galactokinase